MAPSPRFCRLGTAIAGPGLLRCRRNRAPTPSRPPPPGFARDGGRYGGGRRGKRPARTLRGQASAWPRDGAARPGGQGEQQSRPRGGWRCGPANAEGRRRGRPRGKAGQPHPVGTGAAQPRRRGAQGQRGPADAGGQAEATRNRTRAGRPTGTGRGRAGRGYPEPDAGQKGSPGRGANKRRPVGGRTSGARPRGRKSSARPGRGNMTRPGRPGWHGGDAAGT